MGTLYRIVFPLLLNPTPEELGGICTSRSSSPNASEESEDLKDKVAAGGGEIKRNYRIVSSFLCNALIQPEEQQVA